MGLLVGKRSKAMFHGLRSKVVCSLRLESRRVFCIYQPKKAGLRVISVREFEDESFAVRLVQCRYRNRVGRSEAFRSAGSKDDWQSATTNGA
jgi:hypothetical protein